MPEIGEGLKVAESRGRRGVRQRGSHIFFRIPDPDLHLQAGMKVRSPNWSRWLGSNWTEQPDRVFLYGIRRGRGSTGSGLKELEDGLRVFAMVRFANVRRSSGKCVWECKGGDAVGSVAAWCLRGFCAKCHYGKATPQLMFLGMGGLGFQLNEYT
jgi:hypothetical protein